MQLSLEQELNVRKFQDNVNKMSHKQAQDFLIELYQQMLMRENYYKNLLKQSWGIEHSNNDNNMSAGYY